MKLAIATENREVSAHFGHCEKFTLVDIEGGKEKSRREIIPPPHEPGLLPRFLSEHNVSCVIAGGMGPRAQQLFASRGIQVIAGVTGDIDEVVSAYIQGKLRPGENLCSPDAHGHGHGQGHGSCHGKD